VIKWYGSTVRKKVKSVVSRKINAAGTRYVQQLRENIGKPLPEPSQPGEYPRRDTGDLLESVYFRMDRRRLRFKAGTDVEYSHHIERLRPHIKRTMMESKSTLVRAFFSG
jgi:hypothetical protein